jgi:cell division protein FtsB
MNEELNLKEVARRAIAHNFFSKVLVEDLLSALESAEKEIMSKWKQVCDLEKERDKLKEELHKFSSN